MDEVLELARKQGAQAEVYRVSSLETSVEYENNALKSAETVDRSGLAIRVVVQGRLGFATSSLPADESAVLAQAIETAAFGKPAGFAFPGAAELPPVEVFDAGVPALTPETLVAMGEALIEPLRRADDRFKADVGLVYAEARGSLANTSGFAGSTHKTFFGGSVSGILVEGESFLKLAEGHYSCRRTEALFPLRDRVLAYLTRGRRNVALPSGRYPVLFTPAAHATLLGPLHTCLNGKAVEKGASPFRERLGEEICASTYTLVDDPLRPFFPATSAYDAEGLPCRRNYLVEEGRLRNFFLDLDTAAALGLPPNGNAHRGGWAAPPAPGASTLAVSPGGTPSDRLLSGLKEGLLVHHLMGADQGNPYGGAINANILLGFLVRDGEIVGRVKNTMLAVNVFDLLRSQIVELSSDSEDLWGSMSLPHLLADGVDITAQP